MDIYSEAFYKHWILFPTVWHLPRLSQGPLCTGALNARWVGKSFYFRPISRYSSYKRLKIDVYMLGCVWQALNSLSIRVTFTGIVLGAYTGEARMYKKCAKMVNLQNSGLNCWETVEDRWVYTARRFTSIESSFQPCHIYRNCPRGHSVRGR